MALKLRKGGVWQDITGLKLYAAGAWRTIKNVKVYASGAWRDVANFVTVSPMSAKAVPAFVGGSSNFSVVTTGSTTVTPIGGSAPCTYAWVVSTAPYPSFAVSPTSATTVFRCSGIASGDDSSGTATCTVTDSLGSTATALVSLAFSRA